MASRTFYQFQGFLEKGMVVLSGNIEIGNAGAIVEDGDADGYGGSHSAMFKGITVTKDAAVGKYSIQLDQPYARLVHPTFDVVGDSSRDVIVTGCNYKGEAAVTTVDEVIIQVINKSGVAATLSNATIYGTLRLKNSRS
jgi:hypothetical protein